MLDFFGFLVAFFEASMLFSFILFIPTTVLLRIYTVYKHKKSLKESLLIVLLPFSIGYYYYLNDEEKTNTYNIIILVFVALSVIGIILTVYQWIPPFLNP